MDSLKRINELINEVEKRFSEGSFKVKEKLASIMVPVRKIMNEFRHTFCSTRAQE